MSIASQRDSGPAVRQPEQLHRTAEDNEDNEDNSSIQPGADNSAPRNGKAHSSRSVADRPARQHALPRYRPVSEAMAIAPTITVVIPAMNEARNLPDVFATLPGHGSNSGEREYHADAACSY